MTMDDQSLNPLCPLCGSNKTQPRLGYQRIMPGNWSLHQCAICATSFMNPMPDSEALAKYYDDDYYGSGEGKFLGFVEGIVQFFRYVRARAVRRLTPSGRILDVGCGRGLMLKFLKTWGYQVDGIELDTVAAVRARKNLNQQVFHTLEELAASFPQHYQAICFWHSLEHLPDPGKALGIAHGLLAPGGLLVISAPHAQSYQSRLSNRFWLHLDLPRHLVHFDMNRLTAFFQTRGYRPIRHEHFSQEYNVIDTLCFLYAMLGFDHLYPFHLIRGKHVNEACRHFHDLSNIMGLSLLLPLTGLSFFIANFFSLLRSGSTTTLYLRKA